MSLPVRITAWRVAAAGDRLGGDRSLTNNLIQILRFFHQNIAALLAGLIVRIVDISLSISQDILPTSATGRSPTAPVGCWAAFWTPAGWMPATMTIPWVRMEHGIQIVSTVILQIKGSRIDRLNQRIIEDVLTGDTHIFDISTGTYREPADQTEKDALRAQGAKFYVREYTPSVTGGFVLDGGSYVP